MRRIVVLPPEILITATLAAAMALLSLLYGLRISLPTGASAIVFATQTALPMLAIGLWVLCEAQAGRSLSLSRRLVAAGCYAIIMIVHFNLKLWVPFVRPVSYDALFWRIDQWAYPVVRFCMAVSAWMSPFAGADGGAYVGALAVMFYVSFGYHACRTPEMVRQLFFSALILQALGAVSYYVLPALGPFLYQDGTTPALTAAQHNLLAAHQLAIATGPRWLIAHGDATLFAGLGAMPSLHAAGSYLFVWFAWRHGRILLPAFLPLFAYILVTAVASRWHYLIDIPAGIALARLSILLACRLDAKAHAVEAAMAGAAQAPFPAEPWGVPWPSAAVETNGGLAASAAFDEPPALTAIAAS